ncbi:Ger(x)C family spore germination protein [Bacillus alkalicellulosilyticus]|uniref:Ger(x)C family spore germination protein n=1 Tax=Alkalihalobacterium alkalicellulosilyticum TaxID=1912214 RepID=UPI000997F614|nr:Ger(x)C family spore germination protein [Bacillus alkalicellulosilyticus]
MKKLLLLLFVCIFLLQTGCWDRQELNEIAIVTGLAVDLGENGHYVLSVEILNPPALDPQTGGDRTASIVYSFRGQSIAELFHKMNVAYTRTLIYSHMRTVVISEEVAKDGIAEFLDLLERDREVRNDFNIITVSNANASDVLKITYPIQQVSTMKLNTQLQTMVEEWSGDPEIRLKDIIESLVAKGGEPVCAAVKIEGSSEKGSSMENTKTISPDAIVTLDGLSVFKGDNHIGKMELRDTRNYMWLTGKLRKTTMIVPCEDGKFVTATLKRSKTNVEAKYVNGIPTFHVSIVVEGKVAASQCGLDFMEVDTIRDIEKKVAHSIESELRKTVETVQDEFQSDIFGFGEKMRIQDYENFLKVQDHWNEEFARAKITFDITAKIRRTGLTTESFLNKVNESN